MTAHHGSLISNKLPLSPVSVGGLQDLGYDVNYTKADAFSATDLDPTCVCTPIIVDQSDEQKAQGSVMFKLNEMFAGLTFGTKYAHHIYRDRKPVEPPTRHRKLSAKGRLAAMGYGQQFLREEAIRRRGNVPDNMGDQIFIGDRFVNVLYAEDGEVYTVEVWGDDDRRL